ncbi:bifunctional [glutamine synthetase] adenylyltransferase/[glutamine synthetase]-adenylyl-L-tyrosine phosphorylase [Rhodovibrionaceae bacterium A322]
MTFDFLSKIKTLPAPADSELAQDGIKDWIDSCRSKDSDTAAAADSLLQEKNGRDLLAALFGNSPFLGNLARREAEFFLTLVDKGPKHCLKEVLAGLRQPLPPAARQEQISLELRVAKRRVALLTAVADLSQSWPLMTITRALSDLADAALDRTLTALLQQLAERNQIVLPHPDTPLKDCGLTVLAMGKYGAKELNYSSDIDIILLYEPAKFDYQGRRSLQEAMVKVARDICRLMDERTAEGYVFRTDLRLRPDPGATPLALPLGAALTYYESQGQNWERAAMIKARACAGDIKLGEEFLYELTPFVWRKHLDFWAIQDVHSIKRQIYAHKGGSTVAIEGHNIKLGRGGIREIEFYAQTQQLIYGGRDPALRSSRTLDALDALVAASRMEASTAEELKDSYHFLRTLEHRLQMINDQQTHSLPEAEGEVDSLAVFMGYDDSARFRQDLVSHLRRVENHYAELFEEAPSLSDSGSLVFTGAEPDPDTTKTLTELGYSDPEQVFNLVRGWHHGRYRSTRSVRARELLTEMMPQLLQEFAKGQDPQQALIRFDAFLEGLPSGVQVFSLLYQNPSLLEMLAEIMGQAPALAERLSSRAGLLEAVLSPSFFAALPPFDSLKKELDDQLLQARDYQDVLDITRRWSNDRRFQVGLHILRQTVSIETSGKNLSDIADAAVSCLLPDTHRELALKHGTIPGSGMAVLALGKLGAQEMTVSSDLDLVFLYESEEGVSYSNGDKPIEPSLYYGRLAQRLITALSAQTSEGSLYEVDPRLRPSGSDGPIALSLAGFLRYQREEAWTWEHMSLTKARVVAGDPEFCARILQEIRSLLTAPRDHDALLTDISSMRERIRAAFPGKSLWDAKYRSGGLYDIDFLAQYLQLRHAAETPEILCHSSIETFEEAAFLGYLSQAEAEQLKYTTILWQRVQNFLRLTIAGSQEPEQFGESYLTTLAKVSGFESFKALEANIEKNAAVVSELYGRMIREPAQKLEAKASD